MIQPIRFPYLLSPLAIRGMTLRNRIVSTAHHTHHASDVPTDRLIAYHEARARGGVGLIIVEAAGVHPSGRFASHMIMASERACIPGYTRIAEVCHRHGAKVLGQLFHPGRETRGKVDGATPVAWAPSALPGERHHVMPRAMPLALIEGVIEGYAVAARNLRESGLDGVEILASQGYLLAQFLSPHLNRRTDRYGGSFENRLRFVRDIIAAVRAAVGALVVGIRVSADACAPDGASDAEMAEICAALEADGEVDYFSLVLGSSATLGGSRHIVPPMELEPAYVMPAISALSARISKPVIAAGRINQPQLAEAILARGDADLCGMTRALISDPEMPNKVRRGELDDIRACIACNQACTGHGLYGFPISCIQRPETGREAQYEHRPPASPRKHVLVAGGGPGGLKAAAVAAERGHRVTLLERGRQVGGQALLAQRLPGRAEFGGLITHLARECERAGVEMKTGIEVTPELVASVAPDVLIVATGARPYVPEIPGAEDAHVVTAWQVLLGEANVGASVVIADWRSDWVGLGLAEMLAAAGSRVRLCVSATTAGESLQQYVRDSLIARVHRLGVEVIPYARLYGVDEGTAYFQHVVSDAPILCEATDTLVLALGHESVTTLETELSGFVGEMRIIGDCLAPRTAEEAVLEGLQAGFEV